MSKQKVILFDIDYTLFDVLKFRKKIFKKIRDQVKNRQASNLNRILDHAYLKSRKEVGYFKPSAFIKEASKKLNLRLSKKLFEKDAKSSRLFSNLYKETKKVLENLSSDKNLIIGIFSGGEDKFQKEKIKDLEAYLHKDHVHIFLLKEKELEKVINKYKNSRLFIIDDVLKILYLAKKIDENVVTIWIKRGRFAQQVKKIKGFKPDAEINNLEELMSIINKN